MLAIPSPPAPPRQPPPPRLPTPNTPITTIPAATTNHPGTAFKSCAIPIPSADPAHPATANKIPATHARPARAGNHTNATEYNDTPAV